VDIIIREDIVRLVAVGWLITKHHVAIVGQLVKASSSSMIAATSVWKIKIYFLQVSCRLIMRYRGLIIAIDVVFGRVSTLVEVVVFLTQVIYLIRMKVEGLPLLFRLLTLVLGLGNEFFVIILLEQSLNMFSWDFIRSASTIEQA
jgi:hypothetical protein